MVPPSAGNGAHLSKHISTCQRDLYGRQLKKALASAGTLGLPGEIKGTRGGFLAALRLGKVASSCYRRGGPASTWLNYSPPSLPCPPLPFPQLVFCRKVKALEKKKSAGSPRERAVAAPCGFPGCVSRWLAAGRAGEGRGAGGELRERPAVPAGTPCPPRWLPAGRMGRKAGLNPQPPPVTALWFCDSTALFALASDLGEDYRY